MKVVIMGEYPAEAGKITGGVQSATNYLVQGLGKHAYADLDLHVINFAPRTDGDRIEKRDGATVYLLDVPGSARLATAFSAERRKLAQYLPKIRPDLIHAQGAGRYGYLALNSGYPYVLTVHGIGPEDAKYENKGIPGKIRAHLFSRYYYASLKKARWIISISPYVDEVTGCRAYAEVFPIENAISDIYYGLPNHEEPGRLLYVGFIGPRKGMLDLVEAMRILKEKGVPAQVRVAGGRSDQSYSAEVDRRISEYGLADRFDFLGPLGDKGLMDEYSRCAALVLPSYQETSPMVIQQAMAAGKPSVATDVGGVRPLLGDGKAGLVTRAGDPGEFAEALGTLLGDADMRQRMGQAAIEMADSFRATEVARKTYEAYQRILG